MAVNKTRTLLIPEYMQQFKCIGSDCEDTCCAGWTVHVDKATYKKYRNCRDKELKDLLDDNVIRNRNNPNETNYAKMKLRGDLSCSFLNEEKLCSIQLKLGEDHLSTTCKTYPRSYNTVNKVKEKSAVMSCPEAARLALLNPDKMEFLHIQEQTDSTNLHGIVIDGDNPNSSNKISYYFWDLRVFTIQVLQSREYRLWERLVLLGIFYQTIQECIEQKKPEEIPEYIAEYLNGIAQGIFDETLQNIPSNELVQLNLLIQLLSGKIEIGGFRDRFLECYQEFQDGIKNEDEAATISSVLGNYSIANETYYEPFIKEHEYILENYLVNYVFTHLFPLYKTQNIFENYVLMVTHYSLIKMFLIGMAGFHKENFDTKHVIKLISSFVKKIEHNPVFLNKVVEFFKEKEYATLSHMMLLIKN